MKTDLLTIKNILDGGWSILRSITVEVEKIKALMQESSVQVSYTYREAKKLQDFMANHIFFFAEMNNIHYSNL